MNPSRGVWDMSWRGIDVGSGLNSISYVSASWNDRKYAAREVCLSARGVEALHVQIQLHWKNQ